MRDCPECGNSYPDSFDYCPADGAPIRPDESRQNSRKPAQIRVRTVMLGFSILVMSAVIAFAAAFFYQYWKPKYGSLSIKTTPSGASIYIDGQMRGVSPVTIEDLRSGSHQLRGVKEGYKDLVQQLSMMPYASENRHWSLEPKVPQPTNEQLAEIEAWRIKLDTAQKENILLPPPDDYNVLYFADKILAIDPANGYANEVKARLAETVRRLAELAYAREDWLEAEKQYRNLSMLFPNEISITERLSDVAAKIDASIKDREKQIQDWQVRADAAIKMGRLVPPDKENALDAIQNIQRLDKNNSYARNAISRVKEQLQNRGDTKIAASDWQNARADFRHILEYFPEDTYSKSRLLYVEGKISEVAQLEQQRKQQTSEEQKSKQYLQGLRQSALTYFRQTNYDKSIEQWQEYLKYDPNSDEAYFYIGASYQNEKQLDTAIYNFELCLSLNPGNVLAHLNLGLLYDYHRNNFKLAEEHLRKTKELGGAQGYSPERLSSLIQDLQDRAQAGSIMKAPFPVEHKHAFSSCRGNIYLTEHGIEFRTAQTDHSFYESYKGLRTFDLKGSELTIRTGTNKKYSLHFINASDAARVRAWNSAARLAQTGSHPD